MNKVKNPKSGKLIKINGPTYNKLYPNKKRYVKNPKTGRKILVGGSTYNKLQNKKYTNNCYNANKISLSKNPPNGFVESKQGARPSMEDEHIYARCGNKQLWGVFDGHGGKYVSDAVSKTLPGLIFKHLNKEKDIGKAIRAAYVDMDYNVLYKKWLSNKQTTSGSTAAVVLKINNDLYFINLGDSRSLLMEGNKIIKATDDHKPDDIKEKTRIQNNGGKVTFSGVPRVNGNLATSRAFGDFGMSNLKTSDSGAYLGRKALVSMIPDIFKITLKPGRKYTLVLACDGLWDVYSNQEVANIIYNSGVSKKTTQSLVYNAINKRKSTDNVSLMIVQL